MRVAMRAVTNTFAQSGRMNPARPNGTKEDGAIGEDGLILSSECMAAAMHATMRVDQYRSWVQACQYAYQVHPRM
jgi:hypothetical protein